MSDPLGPARGCVWGVLLSIPLWILYLGLLWWLLP